MGKVTVRLTDKQIRDLETLVEDGRYESRSAAIRAAIDIKLSLFRAGTKPEKAVFGMTKEQGETR